MRKNDDVHLEEASERDGRAVTPRLARHLVRLDNGHRVSVAVAGRGVPFVVVHGFMAEGFMYAQTLSRLVGRGYKVVAIDVAGHGGTGVLPDGEWDFASYVDLLGATLDHLGIRRAVFAGHSMGGRLVAELAAADPSRVIGLLLLDPIFGAHWDAIVARARVFPPLLALRGGLIAVDTLSTFPVVRDRLQAQKLARLMLPVVGHRAGRPWRLVAPAVAILRAGTSGATLARLRAAGIPVVVVHGDRDVVVPLDAGRDVAGRTRGELIVVHRGTHSWLLKDPETLPAVVEMLSEGRLGRATAAALESAGLSADTTDVDDVERVFYAAGAPILELTPPLEFEVSDVPRGRPRYRFSRVDFGASAAGVA